LEEQTNLRVLKKTRRSPEVGDVFAMQLSDLGFLFGLVVKANVKQGQAPMPGANLIYVFRVRADRLSPDLVMLRPDQLLLPPIWTNALAWSRGRFQTVAKVEIDATRVLPGHCFWRVANSRYVDEFGEPVGTRTEPCGDWGLVSYRWIDDRISDALGIPRVPETA
jgi:hypothetical protein